MDRSVVWLVTCSDMACYLAGCATLYALDPGPTMEILEILGGKELRKQDLHPKRAVILLVH